MYPSGMRQRQNEGRKLNDAYKFVTRQSLRWSALSPTPSMLADTRYGFQNYRWPTEGLMKINTFRRSKIVFPLVSIIVLAQSAYAEEPNNSPSKAALGKSAVHPGPGRPGPALGRGPREAHFTRGALPSRNFGGHAYHGHLAWEGGRWRHEMRNGRDGWWWDVGGAWYFYPKQIDGPPTYVSDVEVMDDAAADPPAADGYPPPPGAYAPAAAYAPPPPPPPDPAASAVGGAIV